MMLPIVIIISGCDNAVFDSPIEKAVRMQLKDPDSAKFGKEVIVKSRACISFNAKNSYGGYSGVTIAHLKRIYTGIWYVDDMDGESCYPDILEKKLIIDEEEGEKANKALERAKEAEVSRLIRPR